MSKISSKTMSMLMLLAIIFISLSLSGYSYLVSRKSATPPPFIPNSQIY